MKIGLWLFPLDNYLPQRLCSADFSWPIFGLSRPILKCWHTNYSSLKT